MGVGMMAAPIVRLIRILYWQTPKRYGGYRAKKWEAHIDLCITLSRGMGDRDQNVKKLPAKEPMQ